MDGYVAGGVPRRGRHSGRAYRRRWNRGVAPFAAWAGTKCPHSGPASRLRISARNLADTHLSFAGMIVGLSSTLIWSSLHALSFYHVLGMGEDVLVGSDRSGIWGSGSHETPRWRGGGSSPGA